MGIYLQAILRNLILLLPCFARLVAARALDWASTRPWVWDFLHNSLAHPCISFPRKPRWAHRLHNWTMKMWDESERILKERKQTP